LIEQLKDATGYNISEDELEDETIKEILEESSIEIFEECLKSPQRDIGVLKLILKNSWFEGHEVLTPIILDNFDVLMRIYKDVCIFFYGLENSEQKKRIRKFLTEYLLDPGSTYGDLDYQRLLSCMYFVKSGEKIDIDIIDSFEGFNHRERFLLYAKDPRSIHRLKFKKENIFTHDCWNRRALIMSLGESLPILEKSVFFKHIKPNCDKIDKAIIKYIENKNNIK
jgi:hypothetical protein